MAEEGEISKRLDDVPRRLDDLRGDMNTRFRTLTWLIVVWFSFLTLLTVLFKFLHVILYTHVRERGLGEVFHAPFDVILEKTSVVVPDLLFVSRDRLERAQLYARHGVRHDWLVDPEAQTLPLSSLWG